MRRINDGLTANQRYYRRHRAKSLAATKRWADANKEARAAYNKAWTAANRDKVNARYARYRKANPERCAAKARKVDWRTVTPKPSACEVCGTIASLNLDHDHKTQAFRGWLCRGCNHALGNANDDPALLRALAQYLEERNGAA